MKLYTEEEIRRTFGFEMHEIEFKSFMNAIKPIDLPSDEEIEEKLNVAYGNGYEQGEMDFYKKMRGKEMSYADGYAEGYKRALEMVEWYIKNYISGMVQDHIGDTNKKVDE